MLFEPEADPCDYNLHGLGGDKTMENELFFPQLYENICSYH